MIEVDKPAQEFIKKTGSLHRPLPHFLRAGVRGGGCTGYSYFFEWSDEAQNDDDTLLLCHESFGVIVDSKSRLFLDGSILSAKKSMIDSGLFWKNPNQRGTCGCGKSVTFDLPVI